MTDKEWWKNKLVEKDKFGNVITKCGKCGAEFSGVTMYSCQKEGCPLFVQTRR